MKNEFEINFLDHVAIRVKSLETSADWYAKVLGLRKYKLEAWGEFPVFMMAGKAGVALFPADSDDPKIPATSRNVKIDHFAFNVSQENFANALKKYESLGLEYTVKDHTYFDSVYTQDPDGHTVELTSIKVNEDDFYKLT